MGRTPEWCGACCATEGKWNYDELRDKLRLRDHDLNAALGWLAREDKIEFEHEGGSTQIYLKEAVGTNNFFF